MGAVSTIPTSQGPGGATIPNGNGVTRTPAPRPSADEQRLFEALIKRGRNGGPSKLVLTEDEERALCLQITNDFSDTEAAIRQFKENKLEMTKNWRGTKEQKDFPFVGASNIHVPLTSSFVETMLARLMKAIFGSDLVTEFGKIDEQVERDKLDEMNQWFDYEIKKIIKLKKHIHDILHNTLITGIGLSVPSYHHETRYLHARRAFDVNVDQPLTALVEEAAQKVLNDQSEWGADAPVVIEKQTKPGYFKLNDGGEMVFSIEMEDAETGDDKSPQLVVDTWRRETIFDGVRCHTVNLEDLAVIDSDCSVDDIPFFGMRMWVSSHKYREKLDDGFFIDYGEEENTRIVATSVNQEKTGQDLDTEESDLQDEESGSDSRDTGASTPSRSYIEVYRWEGWWVRDKNGEAYTDEKLLQPAVQLAVWTVPGATRVVRIKRLEDLNKDAKRSAIKFDFIREPGRFFSLGLAEWVRHSQAEMDAIHNQRLDAGLLTNVPFGFYKSTAGIKGQVIKIEPGKLFPVADPQGVNFPKTNWVPMFSFQEEGLVKSYAGEQAGITGPTTGQATSKRQSASEFVGLASSIDLRTEGIVEQLVESLDELLHRVLGLYQQYGPPSRIFRAGGEGGVEITKRFERDRLNGKILLRLTANLQQVNEQLQRQLAMDMLSLLLNEILIQTGIVGPDTIYGAVKMVAKLSHYDSVPLHQPQAPPQSDAPSVENHQMAGGQKPKGPTETENFDEHLQIHAMLAADKKVMDTWTPEARQLLASHIQETIKMQAAHQLLMQQRAAMATQMANSMAEQGIRPGKAGGQQPGENAGAGSEAEGVAGAGGGASAPAPAQ